MDKLPTDFYVGDVYLETEPTYRQWIAGEALQLCNASFWLQRGANTTQADDIEQTFIEVVRKILDNDMSTPIGQIITTVMLLDDTNWLRMDGILRDGNDYPLLMDVIPSAWQALGMFTLPAMSVKTLIGAVPVGSPNETTYGIGRDGGSEQVALITNQMPTHSHGVGAGNSFINGVASGGNIYSNAGANRGTYSTTTAGAGDGLPHDNMPPFLTVYYYIRAR